MATSLDESNLNQDIPLLKEPANDYVNDKQSAHNDDTDRDNDDEDVNGDEFLMSPLQQPPPVPETEPPPPPMSTASRPQDDLDDSIFRASLPSDEIKKALLDNMKCVENWKIEQEMLMRVRVLACSSSSTCLVLISRIDCL